MAHVSLDATSSRPPGAVVSRSHADPVEGASSAPHLGWVLDGFDFTILTFLLVDIQRSFTVDKALAGALGTITLIFRRRRRHRRSARRRIAGAARAR